MRKGLYSAHAIAFLILTASRTGYGQAIHVKSNVEITRAGGWYPYYEMKIDPGNSSNRIVCGAEFDSKDDAFYGAVYSSTDDGKTWQRALQDKHSTFESEHSCAFGAHGVAYYVVSASKVVGETPHHELGTTHIYVSHDSGKTWRLGATTGWTDWPTSVVDTNPGPNQNRLYIFFNSLQVFYSSIGDVAANDAETSQVRGSRVGLISYKDGDGAITGPFSSEGMKKAEDHGAYPTPSLILKDGSIVTFFSTNHRTENGTLEFAAEVVRTNSARTALDAPVQLVSLPHQINEGTECGSYFLEPGGAYNPARDQLYFAYPVLRGDRCRLFLTSSLDGGRTWSTAREVRSPELQHTYNYLTLAVNKDGVLGLLWLDKKRSGCWQFAASTDGGNTISRAQQLGTCSETSTPSKLSSAYLWTSFFEADPKQPESLIRINLRNARNSVWRNQDAVVATPDGTFHAVWSDAGDGNGELRAAAIRVTSAETLIASAVIGLEDVTAKTAILYGGDQSYDPKTNILLLNMEVRNDTGSVLKAPIKLVVPSLYKDYGLAEIIDMNDKANGPGAVEDISSAVPGGVLAPGAISEPFSLKFRYLAEPDTPRVSDDILGLNVKVYAKPSE